MSSQAHSPLSAKFCLLHDGGGCTGWEILAQVRYDNWASSLVTVLYYPLV